MSATCTFYWYAERSFCTYKYPPLPPGPPPPVPAGCRVESQSFRIIKPNPPRTEPSPLPCFYAGMKEIDVFGVNDPNNCARCPEFPGYPDSWPPRILDDPRYGPHTEKWKATGEEKASPIENLRYLVEWNRTIRCKDRSGNWGSPRNTKTTIAYNARWIIVGGVMRFDGSTSFLCDRKYL